MATLAHKHRFLHQIKREWDQEEWCPDEYDERREEPPKVPSVELFVERNLPLPDAILEGGWPGKMGPDSMWTLGDQQKEELGNWEL